jgi:hypothetical protein
MLLRYRLSVSIVLAALAATVAVFAFARPQYHDPFPGQAFDLSYAKLPVSGWRWPGGTPGFRFGQDEPVWNEAKLRPAELAGAREIAGSSGVDPDSLRVLSTLRARNGDPFALLAGSGRAGRTCLGGLVAGAATRFACRLGRQLAFVIVAPRGRELYVIGVARSDVTGVTLDVRGLGRSVLYSHRYSGYWWGAFAAPLEFPRRWSGRFAFYGPRHALMASIPVSSGSPPTFTHV